jgi:dihydrofolate reductase
MSRVRVCCFSVSIDGFGAGPNQSLEHPLGERGEELHQWVFPTHAFRSMHGDGSQTGETGIDNDMVVKGFENVGAWILGRNMFAPSRGPWPDDGWKGWWGENPVYHVPVFVLTHHARDAIEMKGGTTFYFVTDGIESALSKAKRAANGKDVRIGGGVSTVRQYLMKGLIDEAHVAISPVLPGKGESLWADLDLRALGYNVTEHVAGERATHHLVSKVARS